MANEEDKARTANLDCLQLGMWYVHSQSARG